MYPLKLIRKVFKILQSELSPAQVGAGFSLGIFMGLAPLGLHSLLLVSLALLLRLSFSSFLIAFGLFKIFYLPLRGASYALGEAILEWPPLDPLWQTVLHWPIIAPLGFERYLLFGSYMLSFLIAIPTFFLVRFLVGKYRQSFLAYVEGSQVYQRLRERRWFKLLLWLFTGGEARFLAPRRRGLFRYLRREMLIGLPLLYLILYLLAGAIVPFFTNVIITQAGTVLVGSEVSVERSRFNLFTGRLAVEGLAVQNPQEKSEDVMAASELVIDVGILPLLGRRVIFNEGAIKELRFHVRREADGSLNIDNFKQGWRWEPYLEWLKENAGRVDWFKLFQRYIEYRKQKPPRPAPPPLRGAKPLQPKGPSFIMEELDIDRVHLTLQDDYRGGEFPRITGVDVVLENLSIDSRLGKRPILLSLQGQLEGGGSFRVEASLDYRREPALREYTIELKGIDLPAFADFYAASLPVRVTSGKLTVSTKLVIEGDAVRAENNLLLEDLQLELEADSIFGLDPVTSAKVIEGLNRYGSEFPIVFGFLIDGSTSAPEFHWEKPLLEVAQKGLMLLGRRELQRYIDRLGLEILNLEKLETGEVPLGEGFAQVQQAVQSLITEQLGLPGAQAEEGLEVLQSLIEKLFGKESEEE
jgi:uncharacterized protein (TIGR03546 family)